MPRRKQTAVRIDPDSAEEIQKRIDTGEVKDFSKFIRDAIKERLSENRVCAEIDPESMQGVRRMIDIGMYDSIDSFTRDAVLRLLYSAKDKETIRDALYGVFLNDPKFKDALREFIHEVFVEGFRPPPKH